MLNLDLNTVKKLYNKYSPLKTNTQLTNDFQKTVREETKIPEKNIRDIYNKHVTRHFINETVIKSAFIEKFSLRKSPNNTVTIFEMNTGSSRADICMINGKSMVYEIKTEYDTFARLDTQLSDYLDVFEYVNLIVPESKIQLAEKFLDNIIGIIYYNQNRLGNIKFHAYREPVYNKGLSSLKQLENINKSALSKMVDCYTKTKPELIQEIFKIFDEQQINQLFKDYIKNKYIERWKYIHTHQNELYPLDYQWFFKNNIPISTVYK